MLGANGSGKSTLFGVIAGLIGPDAGAVEVRGGRRALGVVFQTPALDPLLSIEENLRTAGAVQGMDRRHASARIDRLLDAMGLTDRRRDRVGRLSGGLARRADLARAMLSEPSVLLLDEATGGLDPVARSDLFGLIDRERAARRGAGSAGGPLTVLAATHLLDEAEQADRVVVMAGGRIVADGSPEDLRAELRRRLGPTLTRVRGSSDAVHAFAEDAGVEVRPEPGERTWVVQPGAWDAAPLMTAAQRAGVRVEIGPPTLEDVYRETAAAAAAGVRDA